MGERRTGSGLTIVLTSTVLFSASCAPREKLAPLDDLLAFQDPVHCVAGPELKRLTDSLLVFQGEGADTQVRLGRPQAPEAYRRRIGQPVLERTGDAYAARVPLTGTWRGLKVRDVGVAGWLESEGGWWISLDAPWNAALREANAAGFRLDREGRRVEEGDVMSLTVAVERDPAGGSRLSCGYG